MTEAHLPNDSNVLGWVSRQRDEIGQLPGADFATIR